ncbi:hypothetical protein BC829DRAFT_402122 [Chytridium lagenaria]|nr:hypothetical protein BC829DRAFT_402122 [Chytridium lagenaria]
MLKLFGRKKRLTAITTLDPTPPSPSSPPDPNIQGQRRRFSFSFDAQPSTPPTPLLPDMAFKVVPGADDEVQRVCGGEEVKIEVTDVDVREERMKRFVIEDAGEGMQEENVMTKMLSMLGRRRKSVDVVWAEQDLYDESESPHRRLAVMVETDDPTPVQWTLNHVAQPNDLIVLVHSKEHARGLLEGLMEGVENDVKAVVLCGDYGVNGVLEKLEGFGVDMVVFMAKSGLLTKGYVIFVTETKCSILIAKAA